MLRVRLAVLAIYDGDLFIYLTGHGWNDGEVNFYLAGIARPLLKEGRVSYGTLASRLALN
jgi:hypothetical protein